MSNIRFVIYTSVFFISAICLSLGLIYLYDPLQIYHKPYFRETTFSSDMRRQALGIIKHYDFDSYILGTSMLENTSAKEASEKLGGKWVNISLSGSRFNERAIILNYLFQNKKPKQIIYSLEGYAITMQADTSYFEHLYDQNPINDLKEYLNLKFVTCALEYSTTDECVGYSKDLELMLFWNNHPFYYSRFGGFENWIANWNNNQIKKDMDYLASINSLPAFEPINQTFDITPIAQYLIDNIVSFAKDNPQTQFHIILPTHHRLFYRLNPSKDFYIWAQTMSWLIPYCEQFDNIKFYGFDHLDYADDIANYKDTLHYHHNLNSLHIDAIAQNAFILNAQNIIPYLRFMEQKIMQYDATPLLNMIKSYENQ